MRFPTIVFIAAAAFVACANTSTITSILAPVAVVEANSMARRSHNHRTTNTHNTRRPRSTFVRSIARQTFRKATLLSNKPTAAEAQPVRTTTATAKQKPPEDGIYVNKPVLRGQFHKWGAILYPPLLGLPLCLRAKAAQLLLPALLFSFAIESILIVSGTLHTFQWQTERSHQNARKLDFTAIFFGIACFYSSMGKLVLGHHDLWNPIETIVWASAIMGTILKWKFPDAPHWANAGIFLVQGWAALPLVPDLFRLSSVKVAGGTFIGGVFVTLGALAYSLQWPRNVHNKAQYEIIFGPHEMFHLGSLFMVASFWFTMWTRIAELASV
jgi:channel protein (hemolysin III family)